MTRSFMEHPNTETAVTGLLLKRIFFRLGAKFYFSPPSHFATLHLQTVVVWWLAHAQSTEPYGRRSYFLYTFIFGSKLNKRPSFYRPVLPSLPSFTVDRIWNIISHPKVNLTYKKCLKVLYSYALLLKIMLHWTLKKKYIGLIFCSNFFLHAPIVRSQM